MTLAQRCARRGLLCGLLFELGDCSADPFLDRRAHGLPSLPALYRPRSDFGRPSDLTL
jgi:hypothetical protein